MTELSNANILLIGAGKMGGALLEAWLHAGIKPESIQVIEADVTQAMKLAGSGVKAVQALEGISIAPDCIVLAVKPQSMDALLPRLASSFRRKPESQASASALDPAVRQRDDENQPLYLSIAVGKTLAYYEKHLGNVPVVRAMPNTPALIRKGITGLCANGKTSAAQKELADALLRAAGEVVWLKDESLMDVVAAISGSGPAYLFLFMEALIAAGKKHGLPEDMAHKLALHTVRGSAKLALNSTEPLAQLRKNVTSPGGTTEAALKVLMKEDGLAALMEEAVAAAIERAGELA